MAISICLVMTIHQLLSLPSLNITSLELKPCDYNMIVVLCMAGDRKCLVLSMEAVARVDHLKLPHDILWLWFQAVFMRHDSGCSKVCGGY